MTKHIVDKDRSTSGTARVAQFTRIEAGQKPSQQAKMLQRRPLATNTERRARRFMEIERRGGADV